MKAEKYKWIFSNLVLTLVNWYYESTRLNHGRLRRKITCDCGCKISLGYYLKGHTETKKHFDLMKIKNPNHTKNKYVSLTFVDFEI